EARVVVALDDDQRIAAAVLSGDEPRSARCAARPAATETLPLPERVVGKSLMAPDGVACCRLDRSGLGRQVSREKLAKRPFADKADAGRILLGVRRYPLLAGDGAHVALGQSAHRKHRAGQLRLR